MPYIGNQPSESFTSFATQEFSTSATTSYTLDHAVTNENEIALFINNVRQQPGSGKAYTATGTALTLSAATASTDTMYCVFLGRALQTVTPATNSITAAMVGNDLISGKDALTSSAATTDEFLISDAGTLKRIDAQFFQNTPSFFAYLNSDQGSVSDNTITKVNIDTEVYDTASAFASNKFTPGVAGKYYIFGQVNIDSTNTHSYDKEVYIYKNGSATADHELATDLALAGNSHYHVSISTIVEANTTDYFELYALDNNQGNHAATFRGGQRNTYFGAYKIIT